MIEVGDFVQHKYVQLRGIVKELNVSCLDEGCEECCIKIKAFEVFFDDEDSVPVFEGVFLGHVDDFRLIKKKEGYCPS